jgi:hypothetical protein
MYRPSWLQACMHPYLQHPQTRRIPLLERPTAAVQPWTKGRRGTLNSLPATAFSYLICLILPWVIIKTASGSPYVSSVTQLRDSDFSIVLCC